MTELKDFFAKKVKVINIGVPSFADDLRKQGVETVHVEWRPPAGGNRKLQALLARVERWQNKVHAAKGGK